MTDVVSMDMLHVRTRLPCSWYHYKSKGVQIVNLVADVANKI